LDCAEAGSAPAQQKHREMSASGEFSTPRGAARRSNRARRHPTGDEALAVHHGACSAVDGQLHAPASIPDHGSTTARCRPSTFRKVDIYLPQVQARQPFWVMWPGSWYGNCPAPGGRGAHRRLRRRRRRLSSPNRWSGPGFGPGADRRAHMPDRGDADGWRCQVCRHGQ